MNADRLTIQDLENAANDDQWSGPVREVPAGVLTIRGYVNGGYRHAETTDAALDCLLDAIRDTAEMGYHAMTVLYSENVDEGRPVTYVQWYDADRLGADSFEIKHAPERNYRLR